MEEVNIFKTPNKFIMQQQIIDYTPGGMYVQQLSKPRHTEYVSDGFSKMLGYSHAEFESMSKDDYSVHIVKQDREEYEKFIERLFKDAPSYSSIDYRMKKKDGSIIYVSDSMETSVDEKGNVKSFSSIADITKRKKAEQQLIKEKEKYKGLYQNIKISEERFRMISSFTGVMFYEYNIETKEYISFENSDKVLGYSKQEINDIISQSEEDSNGNNSPKGICAVAHSEDVENIQKAFDELIKMRECSIEARLRCKDGQYRWFSIMCKIIKAQDGTTDIQMGCVRNIDSIKRKIHYLREKASKDSMTGLLNKVSASKIMEEILRDRPEHNHALIFIDLDNFKDVNDIYGHDIGDKVINYVAVTLKKIFLEKDIIARYGGDEFMVLKTDVSSRELVENNCIKINEILGKFCYLENKPLKISASIGVALSKGNTNLKNIIEMADEESYRVKNSGKGSFSFAK